MPLPENGSFSLQGHSRPGDAIQSKPKQAMIVRMSAETLAALEQYTQNAPMEFEFGQKPGIYIGDKHFTMRPVKENAPHDLYLRSSTAAKPMAPLKLYANVTGKFTVDRELGADIQEKIQRSTALANEAKNARNIVVVDGPINIAPVKPVGKKRKPATSSMFRKPVQQTDHLKPPTQTSSTSTSSNQTTARNVPSASAKPSAQENSLRSRLVRCIALGSHTTDEIMRLVGGKSNLDSTTRATIQKVLDMVAEQANPSASWSLKLSSWKEVRPYEWTPLSDNHRTNLARQTRSALQRLGIPESDPVWEFSKFRKSNNPVLLDSAMATSAVAPQRNTQSKEKKPATTIKSNSDKSALQAKNEGAIAPSSKVRQNVETSRADVPSRASGANNSSTSVSMAPSLAARRLPGSAAKSLGSASLDRQTNSKSGGATSTASKEVQKSVARAREVPPQVGSSSKKMVTVTSIKPPPTRLEPKVSKATSALREDSEYSDRDNAKIERLDRDRTKKAVLSRKPVQIKEEGEESESELKPATLPNIRRLREADKTARGRSTSRDRGRSRSLSRDSNTSEPGSTHKRVKSSASNSSSLDRRKVQNTSRSRSPDRRRERRDRPRSRSSSIEEEHVKRKRNRNSRSRSRERYRDYELSHNKHRERPHRPIDSESELKRTKGRVTDQTSTKRKLPEEDYNPTPSAQKKLKVGNGDSVSTPSTTSSKGVRDLSLPRKPDALPTSSSSRIKESSPMPKIRKDKDSNVPSVRSSLSSSALPPSGTSHKATRPDAASRTSKVKRPSPVYTSSEDEGEIRTSPIRKTKSLPVTAPTKVTSTSSTSTSASIESLPSDHEGLRNRYMDKYSEYVSVFAKVVGQKRMLESLLASFSGDEMEVDDDVMEVDEIRGIGEQHMILRDELKAIQGAYEGAEI